MLKVGVVEGDIEPGNGIGDRVNIFINANRVEKCFWKSSIITVPEQYREHLVIGLDQCVDTKLPQVCLYNKFKPFVEDYIPKIFNNYKHCVLADPSGVLTLQQSITMKNGGVLRAVGLEG